MKTTVTMRGSKTTVKLEYERGDWEVQKSILATRLAHEWEMCTGDPDEKIEMGAILSSAVAFGKLLDVKGDFWIARTTFDEKIECAYEEGLPY